MLNPYRRHDSWMQFQTFWDNHKFRWSSVATVPIYQFDSDLRVEVQGNGKGISPPQAIGNEVDWKGKGCEKGFANQEECWKSLSPTIMILSSDSLSRRWLITAAARSWRSTPGVAQIEPGERQNSRLVTNLHADKATAGYLVAPHRYRLPTGLCHHAPLCSQNHFQNLASLFRASDREPPFCWR